MCLSVPDSQVLSLVEGADKCASLPWLSLPHTHFLNGLYLFIWLHQVFDAAFRILVVTCETSFPDQGWNLSPLSLEHRVLATGPPGKSQPSPLDSLSRTCHEI